MCRCVQVFRKNRDRFIFHPFVVVSSNQPQSFFVRWAEPTLLYFFHIHITAYAPASFCFCGVCLCLLFFRYTEEFTCLEFSQSSLRFTASLGIRERSSHVKVNSGCVHTSRPKHHIRIFG